ncbi:alpha-amylase family glycosyl hydrolase [Geofilum rhodophaeum]|uniref:alpha-amylase family glycosyl hydrolase n=1 Tax=Geofilum rhodophaeum TaxID=1965019 RepID=UPI000B528A93|nr:alpha-amylase family glycosyl hydrolase [Geofilum rhodophaeum]
MINYKLKILVILMAVFAACNQTPPAQKEAPVASQAPVPQWLNDAVIYEVNVRQYTPEGNFEAFADHLPRLKELGVDVLWFMPIYPIGQENRKGKLGSYYSIRDYKAVNPEFGTFEDFKALVDMAHEMGMKVVLDWVANHTAWDHAWVSEHPDWYEKDSTGNMFAPMDWSDVVQLDYDNPEMRAAMQDALAFWVREANIDGYRCDVAGMVPVDFWEEATSDLQQIKPLFMLAEDEDETALLNKAFNANYGWALHHLLNGLAQGTAKASELRSHIEEQQQRLPQGAFSMQFTTNHDENSWNGTAFDRMGAAFPTLAALTFVVEGMPLIYSGQEAGLNKQLDFFDEDSIDWSDLRLTPFYQELIQLKKDNPALWNGNVGGRMEFLNNTKPGQALVFKRTRDNNSIYALFNLSDQPLILPLGFGLEGQYEDALTGEKINLSNEDLKLAPWAYHLISVKE